MDTVRSSSQLPLPFATAGLGYFLSFLTPWHSAPTWMTLIGFVVGVVMLAIPQPIPEKTKVVARQGTNPKETIREIERFSGARVEAAYLNQIQRAGLLWEEAQRELQRKRRMERAGGERHFPEEGQ